MPKKVHALERWKQENGHSWRTLEQLTKITRKTLIDIARGRTANIKPATYAKIRRATGIAPKDLI